MQYICKHVRDRQRTILSSKLSQNNIFETLFIMRHNGGSYRGLSKT